MDIAKAPVTTKARLTKTYSYYLAFITIGLTAAITGPTLQQLAHNTNSQLDQISLIFTTGALGYLLGSLVIGRLYDRIPGHKIIAAALLFSAILTALIPVMPALWLLVIVIALNGLATSSVDVGGNILLIRVHGEKVGPFRRTGVIPQ